MNPTAARSRPKRRSLLDRWLGLPAATHRVLVERDLPMTAPDGVRLLATRYRPDGVERGPVVLMRTPYGRTPGLPSRLLEQAIAARGYQVVVQSVRGTFGSGGDFEPGRHERTDGVAAVGWLREQQWCDGRIAMAGGSYLGTTQWAVAPYLERPLDAMNVSIGSTSMLAGWYPQGALGVGQALRWATLLADQRRPAAALRTLRATRRVRRALQDRTYRTADRRAIGGTSSVYQENIAHVADHAYWRGAVGFTEDRGRVRTPVSMVTGWHDLFLRQQLDDFTALQDAGHGPRITIGPWWHGSAGLLPVAAQETLRTLQRIWEGVEDPRPPIRIWMQGEDRWKDLDLWPPLSDHASVPFPADRPGGGAADAGAITIVHDPDDPTPAAGGPGLLAPAGRQPQRAVEQRSDVLVHTSPPLDGPLEVVGEVLVRATFSTTSSSALVVARLCDVDRRGRSRNVSEGLTRITHDDRQRSIEIALDPTAHRFEAGHRLRLQITVGAHPRVVHPTADGRRARYEVTVHYDDGREPRADLPVIAPER